MKTNAYLLSFFKYCGLKENSTINEVVNKLFWGTYNLPIEKPVKWIRLIDCSTNHLKNILRTQQHIHSIFKKTIKIILTQRKQYNYGTTNRISGLTDVKG